MSVRALKIINKYHPGVESVVDATKGVSVHVSSADCKEGDQKDPSACAMAKAFGRTYDGAIISLFTAYLIRGKRATRYRVPDHLTRELITFDRNRRFEPGTYSLYPMPESLRLGAKNGDRGKAKSPKRRRAPHYTTGVRSL